MDVPISQIKFGQHVPGDFVREGQTWFVSVKGQAQEMKFITRKTDK